jgi:hypothetical protein
MIWCILLLLTAGLGLAEKAAKTFVGVIHDNRPTADSRATQCPVIRGPIYTLQSGNEAWVLTDQKTPAKYAGKRVVVTGTIGNDNKLKVTSIAPAR